MERNTSKVSKYETMLDEILIKNYYLYLFDNLNSYELDKRFYKELLKLTKRLKKLPENDRQNHIKFLANLFELYIESKVEKELNRNLAKLLKY